MHIADDAAVKTLLTANNPKVATDKIVSENNKKCR